MTITNVPNERLKKELRFMKILCIALLIFFLFDVALYQAWRAEEVREVVGQCCKCPNTTGWISQPQNVNLTDMVK